MYYLKEKANVHEIRTSMKTSGYPIDACRSPPSFLERVPDGNRTERMIKCSSGDGGRVVELQQSDRSLARVSQCVVWCGVRSSVCVKCAVVRTHNYYQTKPNTLSLASSAHLHKVAQSNSAIRHSFIRGSQRSCITE